VFECAVSGEADVIVTDNKVSLLPLKAFRGIPILSPLQFVEHCS
jgi:predicted nucleic acid-binding protein